MLVYVKYCMHGSLTHRYGIICDSSTKICGLSEHKRCISISIKSVDHDGETFKSALGERWLIDIFNGGGGNTEIGRYLENAPTVSLLHQDEKLVLQG